MLVSKHLKKWLKSLPLFSGLVAALLFLPTTKLQAKFPRHIWIDSPTYIGGGGFFHNFNIVLGYLDLYEKHPNLSITIDMADQGLYYEASHGPNWWSYYFESLHYPNRLNSLKRPILKRINDHEKGAIGNAAHYYLTRQYANHLIKKYIQVKPEILDEVEAFYREHLEGSFVIGIHYRGTDKHLEASYVDCSMLEEALIKELKKHPEKRVKLFLATDSPNILNRIKELYPEKIAYTNAERYHDPVHYVSQNNFKKGKEALVDALILAKSNVMIRTNSNLGAVSCYFNPDMKVINLNYLNDRLYNGALKNGKLNELNQKP